MPKPFCILPLIEILLPFGERCVTYEKSIPSLPHHCPQRYDSYRGVCPATDSTETDRPPTSTIVPIADSVRVANNSQYGSILVDTNGKTLYYLAKDSPENGTSTCYNQCVVIWPVFHVAPLTVSPPLSSADFGEITRTTGEKQTTFKGWPLYYYRNDTAAGDVKGYDINGVWYVISPTGIVTQAPTVAPTAQPTTLATTKPITIKTTTASSDSSSSSY
jgi:predicted lipoprotein with Yx(FWY)xxD motif